ncbi:MAG: hypothetical protein M3Y26_02580 [Actinomycetota bacterium]|nr:hypothetical protein [Actinomycetota bacterium]
MVSAELAAAIPALLVVLVLALGAVRLGIDQVRCVDAARLAARALARGDSEGSARALATRSAPSGATVRISAGAGEVSVKVVAVRELSGWRVVDVGATSTAAREQP